MRTITQQEHENMVNYWVQNAKEVTMHCVLNAIDEEIKAQEDLLSQDLDAPNYLEAEWREHALDGMRIVRDKILKVSI